jgi:two-component system, chemotaxis family, chemotaxis protein CheY
MQLFLNSLFILLVEPSSAQKKIITQQFDELGVEQYLTADTGAQALDIIESEQPDIVISSMFLEDMTGSDLVLELRENPLTVDTPFILISTVTSFAELNPIKQAGASAVLPKPFSTQDLKRAIVATQEWDTPGQIQLEDRNPENLQILMVDDSHLSRRMIIRTLKKMGFQKITEAENGRQAIPLIEHNHYDLILTDYNMPEMDGHELLLYIRTKSRQPQVPVLMVTTEGDESTLSAIQHDGVSAIVDKPFEVKSIKKLIESALSLLE